MQQVHADKRVEFSLAPEKTKQRTHYLKKNKCFMVYCEINQSSMAVYLKSYLKLCKDSQWYNNTWALNMELKGQKFYTKSIDTTIP